MSNVLGYNYSYFEHTERVSYAQNIYDSTLDRSYNYDQVGALQFARSGAEARAGATPDGPYRESFSYDAWGNTVSQTRRVWSGDETTNTATVVNNRRNDFGYDANGFATAHSDDSLSYVHQYDASGKRSKLIPVVGWYNGQPAIELNDNFDGDGLPNERVDIRREQNPETGYVYTASNTTTYYLHSKMLGGQVVAELDAQGNKKAGHIYVQGMQFANESPNSALGPHTMITWELMDPVTGTRAETEIHRYYSLAQEVDPLGSDVTTPPPAPDPLNYQPPVYSIPENPVSKLLDFDANDDIPDWYLNMAHADSDTKLAQWFYDKGMRDRAEEILARNPNVGIKVTGNVAMLAELTGTHIDQNGTITLWGAQAAAALGIVAEINEMAQNTETAADLAQRAATGLSNHPGLLEQIQKNTVAGVDVHMVACQAAKESNFGHLKQTPLAFENGGQYVTENVPSAIGGSGEIGLLQVMPSTGRDYGASVNDLRNVSTNVRVSTTHFARVQARFNANTRDALIVYNWGEGKYQKYLDGKLPMNQNALDYANKIFECSRLLVLPGDKNPYSFIP